MSLMMVMAVGLGGIFGALLRALAGRWIAGGFPYATLLVNVAGSFLLAATYAALPPEESIYRALICSGFSGALTTFSTFILETFILARSGQLDRAVLNVSLTLSLCCLASWSGFHLLA